MSEHVTRECRDCGRGFPLVVPTDAPPRLLRWLSAVNVCDSCGEAAEAEETRAQEARARHRRVGASGLPRMLQGLSFGDWDTAGWRRVAGEHAQAWARGDLPGLLLTGPFGTGKTRLAATACWARLEHGFCRWVAVPDLIVKMGAAFNDELKYEAIRVLTDHWPGLVLDDLDKVKSDSEWVRSNVFAAINGQIEEGSPLLVTTNLKPGQLAGRFGEAITSRLVGYCEVVEIGGDDRRLAPAARGDAA